MAKYLHDKGTDRLLRDIADAKPAALSVSYEQDDAGNTRFIVNDNAPHSHAKAERIAAILAAAPDLLAACKEAREFLNDGYPPEEISPQEAVLREQLDAAIARAGGAA